MLHEQLRNAWRARERAVPISPAMHFASEGLILGAGTVVVAAEGSRRLRSLRGQEARVLALLSAAYGKAVAPSVVGNITRAVKAWSEGDDCLAYIHLAHARLPTLQDPYDASRRLFIADGFMKAGTSPRAVFEALHFRAAYIDAVEKFFNPDQPRVPAGSGRTSGEWTDESGGDGQPAGSSGRPPASGHPSLLDTGPAASESSAVASRLLSWMANLDAAQITRLAIYGARVLTLAGGAAAVFGTLFVPSPNDIHVEGEVAGAPGLRYSWNRDETLLRLTYNCPDGSRQTFTAQLEEDVFRDQHGRIVGRVLPQGNVVIDLDAFPSIPVKEDEPKLRPDPSPDRRTNEKGLAYENYIKSIVNPENPTLPGMGYLLPNSGRGIMFDDCEQHTGTMVEIKYGYASLLSKAWGRGLVEILFFEQALRQVNAAGTRPVRWYFSEKETEDFARKVFSENKSLENIQTRFEPWLGE